MFDNLVGLILFGLFFFLMHRMHGGMRGCGGGHSHGRPQGAESKEDRPSPGSRERRLGQQEGGR